MNEMSLITELVYRQRYEETLKEAASYRLINEALRNRNSGKGVGSKLLKWIGMQMQQAGSTLSKRYGALFARNPTHNQETSQGDCA